MRQYPATYIKKVGIKKLTELIDKTATLNYSEGMQVIGVDEAGRGPLAGEVFAAAVILDDNHRITGLDDSKKLTETSRTRLSDIIKEKSLAWNIASASVAEIDELNILQATLLAMKRAVEGLTLAVSQCSEVILVDGNQSPAIKISRTDANETDMQVPVQTMIKGDAKMACIAAASILAKVARDQKMLELDEEYPQYAFAKHKGYGTKLHLSALQQHGASPVHRQSFAPVKALLDQ